MHNQITGVRKLKRVLVWMVPVMLLLVSCAKQEIVQPPIDETPWLTQDRALVVFSNFNCDYFAVQTQQGYSVMRSWGGRAPFEGSVLYGDFSRWGVRTFYNRSGGYLMRADVQEYWLSYFAAMDEIQFRCNNQWP
jgi:hypothetical protein